jgi:hypothetical protein
VFAKIQRGQPSTIFGLSWGACFLSAVIVMAQTPGPNHPPQQGEASLNLKSKPDKDSAISMPETSVTVFDGKTLTGWQGDPAFWSVQDGALTGVADGTLKRNHFITWQRGTLKNFDLRVKVKLTAGGNSGIQYRGVIRPDLGADVVTGYQCDVVANQPKYNGMLYEERGRRILSHTGEKVIVDSQGQPWVVGQLPMKTFAPDQWHEYRVVVQGNHHRHWIDGHPTADLIDLDVKGRVMEGVLAVQVHVGPAMKVQYKDFDLKVLPDDVPLLLGENHPIPDNAYGVKPQGKLPKGWTPPRYSEKQN